MYEEDIADKMVGVQSCVVDVQTRMDLLLEDVKNARVRVALRVPPSRAGQTTRDLRPG